MTLTLTVTLYQVQPFPYIATSHCAPFHFSPSHFVLSHFAPSHFAMQGNPAAAIGGLFAGRGVTDDVFYTDSSDDECLVMPAQLDTAQDAGQPEGSTEVSVSLLGCWVVG